MSFSSLAQSQEPNCYTEQEIEQLAGGLDDLAKCRVALHETNKLVAEKLTMSQAEAGAAWWQEPGMVIGGVALSFSVGTLLGWYLVQQK